jgi:hypothetical protein
MLIKGHNIDHVVFGESSTHDGFVGQRFDYMATNGPKDYSISCIMYHVS